MFASFFRHYLPWLLIGGLLPFTFAPFDQVWLPYPLFALAFCMLPTLARRNLRQFALAGWCLGFGFFTVGVSWVYFSIHDYGNASPTLAGGLTLLFTALLSLFFVLQFLLLGLSFRYGGLSRLAARRQVLFGGLLFAAVWVLFEWVRAWLLSGFPWLLLGEALPASSTGGWMSGWAPVAGVYACSLLILLMALALGLVINRLLERIRNTAESPPAPDSTGLPSWPDYTFAVLVLALVLGGYGLSSVQWTSANGPVLSAALVQPNIAQALKWKSSEQDRIVRTYIDMTTPIWDADIILWPETALPLYQHQAVNLLKQLGQRADSEQAAFFTGILTVSESDAGEIQVHNSFIGLGKASGQYDKQRLVPFGEYVPMQSILRGLIDFFNLPMSDMRPGRTEQAPLTMQLNSSGETYTVAALICYEVVYPDFVASQAADVDLMITVSNDTWFGRSIGPLQHLQIARMRALEQQKPILRGTNNGVTAIIGADGIIQDRLAQFESGVLRGEVQPRQGATPFARTGSMPILLLCGLLIVGVVLQARRA
ncbi:apolipoprotein N-acyltransferase [Allohahella marinimesophila]